MWKGLVFLILNVGLKYIIVISSNVVLENLFIIFYNKYVVVDVLYKRVLF